MQFYRISIDFVLKVRSSAPSYSTSVEIDGEDPREFIAGFAENIGLENIRAARMVSAAAVARTHSCSWKALALEVQGKHSWVDVENLPLRKLDYFRTTSLHVKLTSCRILNKLTIVLNKLRCIVELSLYLLKKNVNYST